MNFSLLFIISLLVGCTSVLRNPDSSDQSSSKNTNVLTNDTIGNMLQAEFELASENYDKALSIYMQEAAITNNKDIAKRSFELARAIDETQILKSAKLWYESDKHNADAAFSYAFELIKEQHFEEAKPIINNNIQHIQEAEGFFINVVSENLLTTTELTDYFASLYNNKKTDVYAFWLAYMRNEEGDSDDALNILKMSKLPEASVLYTTILQSKAKHTQAINLLEEALKKHPKNERLRYMQLISLAKLGKIFEFQHAAEMLNIETPNKTKLILTEGASYLNKEQDYEASKLFLHELDSRGMANHLTYLNLAQVAVRENKPTVAKGYLAHIQNDDDLLISRSLIEVDILMREGKHTQAFRKMDGLIKDQPSEFANFAYIFIAESLMDSKPHKAFELTTYALKNNSNNNALLFVRATAADKAKNYKQSIRDLEKVLKNDPNNVDALNFLGYSLTNNSTRYSEASVYLTKALELQPDASHIIDSMGWLYFKQGKNELALKALNKAFKAFPDAEIGAHILEVLQYNNKIEAKKFFDVWNENFKHKDIWNYTVNRLDIV